MQNFKEKTISLASYMLARFLEGKDLNNDNLFSHYLDEIFCIIDTDTDHIEENKKDWKLFVTYFATEVVEGEYAAIIEHSKNNKLNKLFNGLYRTNIFSHEDDFIKELENAVIE